MSGHGYRHLSSRVLAAVVAVAHLAVCATVFTVLSAARGGTSPAGAGPGATAAPALPDGPTWTTRPIPGSEFVAVTGPGGMTTRVPAGWPTRTAPGRYAMQAVDPAGTATTLRYGGSAATATDLYDVHADHERRFAATKEGYTPIRLARTLVRGQPAVDWEYEYDMAGVRTHVWTVYWRHDGHEYFVQASSPVPRWPQTRKVLTVMLTYSTP